MCNCSSREVGGTFPMDGGQLLGFTISMRHFGGLMGLFSGALEQNHTRVSYDYNEYGISRIWMRQLFASAGQIVIFPIDII